MTKATFFLAVAKTTRDPYLKARIGTKAPALEKGEVLLALELDLPDALFTKPLLKAAIKVPADHAVPKIEVSIGDGTGDATRSMLGLR